MSIKDNIMTLGIPKRHKCPHCGKTESLNASIATGVILYEYVRQKLQEK